MISQVIGKYFASRKRLGMEHRDSIYVTSASCDKLINAKDQFSIPVGSCQRVAYYSAIGMEEASTFESRNISRKLGDYTEYMLLKIFEDTGTLVEKQTKFTIDKYHISGKIDAIIKEDDIEAGLEIKSISSSMWTINAVFGSKWQKPFPKIEHLIQCMIYLYAFQERLDVFYLVYIRRDNGDIKEFKIQIVKEKDRLYPVIDGEVYRQISLNNIFSRLETLYRHIKEDKVPPRTYKIKYTKEDLEKLYKYGVISKKRYDDLTEKPSGDIECWNCGYKDLCIRDGE